MSDFDERRKWSERERKRIQEDPDYRDQHYEDVTGEFLPVPVDNIVADVQKGEFDPEDFYTLSREHQKLFLDYLATHCFSTDQQPV